MKCGIASRVKGFVVFGAAVVALASAAYGDPPVLLSDQVSVNNISGAAGSDRLFQFEVPYGVYRLHIRTDGGTGDCDVYVKRGTPPTTSDYHYRDAIDGNTEAILIGHPHAGTWYILLHGKTAYAGVSLWAACLYDVEDSLENGVPVTGLSGAAGEKLVYTIIVPSGQDTLEITTWGGTGDADLYVKHGSKPTHFDYDARSESPDNDETITISHPSAGVWYIVVEGHTDFTDVTLKATYSAWAFATRLEDEVPISGLSGLAGDRAWFVIDVPSGRAGIMFRISGGTGDCDMYIKHGAKPTETDYDYRPSDNGNEESISIGNPAGGSWYVLLKADDTYSGVTLLADYWGAHVPDVIYLTSGVPVTGLAGGSGSEQFFAITTPAGATKLEIRMSGGTGDADLYVKKGFLPAVDDYDFRPYKIGNNETVAINDPAAGTWYIMIRGYQPFAGVTLVATYEDEHVPDEEGALKNGQAVSGIAGAANSEQFFFIEVPAGQTRLEIAMSGIYGDADLYVRSGHKPTKTEWDYRPYVIGNNEKVTIDNPKAGVYYILIAGYSEFADVTLKATYVADASQVTVLENGAIVEDLSGAVDSERFFSIDVPDGQGLLTITMRGGTGDADLYIRKGAKPTTTSWDYRPYLHGNDEVLEVSDPAATTWYIMIHGYQAYAGTTLQACYTTAKDEPKKE